METPLAEMNAFKDNVEAMKKSQEEDPELKMAIDLVKAENFDRPAWKDVQGWLRTNRYDLILADGVLYHIKTIASCVEPVARVVIPKSMVPEMLFRCHGHISAGHPGWRRAVANLEKFATWRHMVTDVMN